MNIRIRQILGYLGLIPFIFLSFYPLFLDFPEGYVFTLLLSFYGGIILSFLGGMTWGWQETNNNKFTLIIGILFSLSGFFIIAFSNMFLFYSLCLSLLSFLSFFIFELRMSDQMQHKGYRTLRSVLTFSVTICYLVSIGSFSW